MNSNTVYKNIQKFVATEVSVDRFLQLLKQSNKTNKMRISWNTEGSADGSGRPPHRSTHLMWWDSSEYVGGSAGGSETKELQDQLNLLVTPRTNNWRTLSYNKIIRFSFKDRLYKVK